MVRFVATLPIWLGMGAAAGAQDRFRAEFAGRRFEADLMRLEGPRAAEFIQPGPEELRWRFAEGNAPRRHGDSSPARPGCRHT